MFNKVYVLDYLCTPLTTITKDNRQCNVQRIYSSGSNKGQVQPVMLMCS